MTNRYYRSLLFFICILLPVQSIFPWGAQGHKLISKMAVYFLPSEMKAYIQWQDYLSEHAPDPDFRKKEDKTEAPKHFIDIDFYKEFLSDNMIENLDSLKAKYGDKEVTKIGVLPWATVNTLHELTEAFKERNKEKALRLAADLGHYVADGHQPMHTVVNYNGQLSGQKGVHFRYESKMIDAHLPELETCFQPVSAPYVNDPMKFVFNYISGTNSVSDVLFDADNLAYKESGSREDDEYYKLLWFRTKYITEVQFNKAAEDYASLLYTAWVNGGKPNIDEMK